MSQWLVGLEFLCSDKFHFAVRAVRLEAVLTRADVFGVDSALGQVVLVLVIKIAHVYILSVFDLALPMQHHRQRVQAAHYACHDVLELYLIADKGCILARLWSL